MVLQPRADVRRVPRVYPPTAVLPIILKTERIYSRCKSVDGANLGTLWEDYPSSLPVCIPCWSSRKQMRVAQEISTGARERLFIRAPINVNGKQSAFIPGA